MAVDRPGDYVGNHGGAYTDESGMSRQFTYIDHDVKPKIYVPSGPTKDTETKKIERTELELLAEEIVHSDMNSNKEFMEQYDELGKKYGFERFNKRSPVTFPQLSDSKKGPEYLKDLKELYGRFTETTEAGQEEPDKENT